MLAGGLGSAAAHTVATRVAGVVDPHVDGAHERDGGGRQPLDGTGAAHIALHSKHLGVVANLYNPEHVITITTGITENNSQCVT